MLAFALLLVASAQDRATTGPVSDDEPIPAATPRCRTTPDEITVCGDTDQSRFRVPPIAPRYRQPPLRPQFTLPGGGTGTVEAAQRGVGGVSVPSAMLTLRIPLGGGKQAEEPE